jgi:hypothetical protein
MENNPVMQRVTMLTDLWKEAVTNNKDMRVCGWVGTSSIDYRMIKGFVMFHTSEKSNLDDVFFSLNQPFEHDKANPYGAKMIHDMEGFISAWNEDKDLTANTGKINWKPCQLKENESDEKYFIKNINRLAQVLNVSGEGDVLVLALLPQTVTDYGAFGQWISKVIMAGISEKVRIMLFDTYELKAFEEISINHPGSFMFLYPNMDMPGAMNQILESNKSKKKDQKEKDAISFQQALIKMNEAISYGNYNIVMIYKDECIQLSIRNNWPHLEALVYFFLHSYFISTKQIQQAHEAIDKAIQKADFAVKQKIVESEGIKYQYRIAKGNFLYMNKNYIEAGEIYKQCLQLSRDGVNKYILLGIYQMLGNSIRRSSTQKEAWQCFHEGWQLLRDEDESTIKNNSIIRFYAKDMMEIANFKDLNVQAYQDKMNEWWGKEWVEKLSRNEYNPVIA